MTFDRRALIRVLLCLIDPSRLPRHPTSPETGEVTVRALASEHGLLIDAIRRLLASARDTENIPEFAVLDDRRVAVVARLAVVPSRTAEDIVAKAGVVVMRAAMVGNDGADPLAHSLAVDIVALAGTCARDGRGAKD